MKKILFYSILVTVFLFVHNSFIFSDAIYKWVDKDGVVHFSNSPVYENDIDIIETVIDTGTGKDQLVFEKITDEISLSNIEQSWYLSSSSMQKEKIYHPRIKFTIKNTSDRVISSVSLRAMFVENGNQIFGRTKDYIRNLPAQYISQTVFMSPSMGFVYNGYNKSTITNKPINIKLYLAIDGKESLIKEINFSSNITE